MPNKFSHLSEEELIKTLDQGNLSENDFADLIAAMEAKGMKGSIMPVGDPDSPGAKDMIEYIEYHKKISLDLKKNEIEEFKKVLSDKKAALEDKKLALVSLAHVGQPDVFAALEKYHDAPDEELQIWAEMALGECQSFLESDITGDNRISVTTAAGKKGGKLRFYFAMLPSDLEFFSFADYESYLDEKIQAAADLLEFVLEKTEIYADYLLVTALQDLDQPPELLLDAIIKLANEGEEKVFPAFWVGNLGKPRKSEIDQWRNMIRDDLTKEGLRGFGRGEK